MWGALTGVVALLVAVRLVSLPTVYRRADVVLLSNDPYWLLFLVERAAADAAVFQPASVDWGGEPLLVWTLSLPVTLFGVEHAPLLLAWYPVVAAVGVGLLVFVLTHLLTDDVRAALVAVAGIAVTPLFVSRTVLGMADHHPFDYVWLALTATALTWLVVRTDAPRRRRWTVGGVLGVAVAAQTLAWNASPLLLVPAGLAIGLSALVLVRGDPGPRPLRPLVAGLALGAVGSLFVHDALAWQRFVVAVSPTLLFVGSLVVLGLAEFVWRTDGGWPHLASAYAVAAVVGVGLLVAVVPDLTNAIGGSVGDAIGYFEHHRETTVGETTPLTGTWGPVLGPTILLGYVPLLGVPMLAVGVVRGWRQREPAWFVLAAYTLWFLALAFVQRRFAVQLGIFLAALAGPGFVLFVSWLDLADPLTPRAAASPSRTTRSRLHPPERERLAILGGIGLVGIGFGGLFSGWIVSRVTYSAAQYRAAAWMRQYAEERGWSYPRNYVLAQWGDVRMYNYFVNGHSRSYGYARDNYGAFLFDSDEEQWYQQFQDRVGFVVTTALPAGVTALQTRLHAHYGSATQVTDGLAHFRAVWVPASGSLAVHALVPGATVTGRTAADGALRVSTTVSLPPDGQTAEYERRVEPGSDGWFSVTVAQPGTYTVDGATVEVTEAAVQNGETVRVDR